MVKKKKEVVVERKNVFKNPWVVLGIVVLLVLVIWVVFFRGGNVQTSPGNVDPSIRKAVEMIVLSKPEGGYNSYAYYCLRYGWSYYCGKVNALEVSTRGELINVFGISSTEFNSELYAARAALINGEPVPDVSGSGSPSPTPTSTSTSSPYSS